MEINFEKYQGTGNDFVIIDNRDLRLKRDDFSLFERLCDRKFGVGADGLMLLQDHPEYDFEMVYYNADGREGSMCGNGGRCIVAYVKSIGLIGNETNFLAVDGEHYAKISANIVSLRMNDLPIDEIRKEDGAYILNTGSPHYVVFCKGVSELNIPEEGKKIRYSDRFKKEGINVNFAEKTEGGYFIRTYERGVEDETLSCGTGVTAVALSAAIDEGIEGGSACAVKTPGGQLSIMFKRTKYGFEEVYLNGPADFVFRGIIYI